MALGEKNTLQVRKNNVHQLLEFLKYNMHNVLIYKLGKTELIINERQIFTHKVSQANIINCI